jgi:hypothetical protein
LKTRTIGERKKVRGRFTGQLIDAKTGRVVQEETEHNCITNVGEEMLTYWNKGDFSTKGYVTHFSLSDDTADPAETDEAEQGSNTGPRKAVTATIQGGKITFETTWGTSEANYTIRRGYLFSAASGGNLFATGKFTAPFPKTSDFSYKAIYEITYE